MNVASTAKRHERISSSSFSPPDNKDPTAATRQTGSYLSQFKAIFANQREAKKRIHETAQAAQGMLTELYQTVVPVAAKLGNVMVEMRQMQYRSVAEQLEIEQKQSSSSSQRNGHSFHSRIPINKSTSLKRNSFSPGVATALGQQHTRLSPQTQSQPSVIANNTPPLTLSTNRPSSRLPRRTPSNNNHNHSYPPFCGSLLSTGSSR